MRKRCAAAVLGVGAALALGGCADSPTASPPPVVVASPSVSPSPTVSASASPDGAATPTVAFCRSVGTALGQSKLPAALQDLQRSGAEVVADLTQAASDTAAALANLERPPTLDAGVKTRADELQDSLTDIAGLGPEDSADVLTSAAVSLTESIGAFTDSCALP